VSLALQKALSENNIKNGFGATRIFSINKYAMDKYFSLSKTYQQGRSEFQNGEGGSTAIDLDSTDAEAPNSGQSHTQTTEQQSMTDGDEDSQEGCSWTLPPVVPADIEADLVRSLLLKRNIFCEC
jgi:hypothetical protein